jgi:hypothetical protein
MVENPVYGGTRKFQEDKNWRDYILFYEYFHGDNGAGLGASHQTGWIGLVARLLQMFADLSPESLLKAGNQKLSSARKSRNLGADFHHPQKNVADATCILHFFKIHLSLTATYRYHG